MKLYGRDCTARHEVVTTRRDDMTDDGHVVTYRRTRGGFAKLTSNTEQHSVGRRYNHLFAAHKGLCGIGVFHEYRAS